MSFCVAQYSFAGKEDTELDLKKGERLKVLEKYDNGWWVGEKEDGKVGVFPGSYVKEEEEVKEKKEKEEVKKKVAAKDEGSDDNKVLAEATADHVAKHKAQLSFKSGDEIQVLERFPTGWWQGISTSSGEQGLFPASLVSIKEVSADTLSKKGQEEVGEEEEDNEKKKGEKKKDEKKKRRSAKKPVCKAVALYSYAGRTKSELTLKKGDVVDVLRKGDPWWKCRADGATGHVPGNYMREVTDATEASSGDAKSSKKSLASASTSTSKQPRRPVMSSYGATEADGARRGPMKLKAVALYPFAAEEENELTFPAGAKLIVLDKLTGQYAGWWKGQYNDQIGHFPGDYCKVVEEVSPDADVGVNADVDANDDAEAAAAAAATRDADKRKAQAPESPTDDATSTCKGDDSVETIAQSSAAAAMKTAREAGVLPKADTWPDEPIGKVRAEFPFDGQVDQNELSFVAGDILVLYKRLDEGWCLGSVHGVVGHFPESYTKVVDANTEKQDAQKEKEPADKQQNDDDNKEEGPTQQVCALYDYEGESESELSFNEGDVFTFISRLELGWCLGVIDGNEGHFPESYVEFLKPKKVQKQDNDEEKEQQEEVKEAEEARKAKEAEEARKAKEAEEVLKAKEAEEARKAKEAEEVLKAKEAEEARKAKEAEEARKAKEAEEARKAKEAEEVRKAKEAEEARKAEEAEEAKKAQEALAKKAHKANDEQVEQASSASSSNGDFEQLKAFVLELEAKNAASVAELKAELEQERAASLAQKEAQERLREQVSELQSALVGAETKREELAAVVASVQSSQSEAARLEEKLNTLEASLAEQKTSAPASSDDGPRRERSNSRPLPRPGNRAPAPLPAGTGSGRGRGRGLAAVRGRGAAPAAPVAPRLEAVRTDVAEHRRLIDSMAEQLYSLKTVVNQNSQQLMRLNDEMDASKQELSHHPIFQKRHEM